MALSQYDIARVTGFSRSTVSRALSNHPAIPAETKRRVQEAADALGYRKNALVSLLTAQLRKANTKAFSPTIAFISSFAKEHFGRDRDVLLSRYFEGVIQRAGDLGYGIDFIDRSERGMTDLKLETLLRARGIRGILIAPRNKPLGRFRLEWSRFAAVSIAHALPLVPIHYSCPAYFNNLGIALRVITKQHYQRIGFAVSEGTDAFAHLAYSGRYAIHSQQSAPGDRLPPFSSFGQDMDHDIKQFGKWFRKYRPEVIIHAGGTIPHCMKAHGWSAPDDVACCDLMLPIKTRKHAGIYQMEEMVGMAAVDLVVEQLHHNELGIPRFQKIVSIQGEWINGPTLPTRAAADASFALPGSSSNF